MKPIIINTDKFLERFKIKKKKPRHEKAAIVDEIIKLVGESKQYNYKYWLKQLKQFEQQKGCLGIIYSWLKEIKEAPKKFNKGGILTNKLKQWRNETNKLKNFEKKD